MPKVFTSQKQILGKLGENLAKRFLVKHGYSILEENYTKKYGEIDLIAQKAQIIHFIEVKSIVSRETIQNVPRETYNPLENVHPGKLRRLSRVIQVYLLSHARPNGSSAGRETANWQFDVITVMIDQKNRIGKVNHIKDIII